MRAMPTLMLYETPAAFGNTLDLWERHLENVRNWPISVENKEFAVDQAKQMIVIKRREAKRPPR